MAIFVKGSPTLGLPEPLLGETILMLLPVYSGPIEEGEEALQPIREHGDPVVDLVTPMPYTDLQQLLDDQHSDGYRWYWKSRHFREVSDEAIDTLVEYCQSDAPFFAVFNEWLEGAISRIDTDATAFPHRDKTTLLTAEMRWSDPERDDEHISWAREFHQAMAEHGVDDVYVNFMDRDEDDRISSAYADKYERLRTLKSKWDPENLFRMNQNIPPAD